MHEFVINVSLILTSASSIPPAIRSTGLNLAQSGDKIIILSIKSETPHEDTLNIKSIIIQDKSPLSLDEQREVNYLGYLK